MPSYAYYRNDCTDCCGEEPEFQSEAGRAKRKKALGQYGTLAKVQAFLSILAMVSGGATIGLAIPNPNYPFMSCLPFICGALMMVAAIFGYKASQSNVDNEIPTSVKRNIGIHYGISVSCCSLCGIAAGNGGWGLGVCLGDDPKNLENCSPEHDLKMAFSISDLCINMLLLLTAIVGSVFFCRYARTFGLSRMQRMRDLEREVQELRAQVHAVNAHGQSNAAYPAAPPAYEYSSSTGQPEYQGGRFAQYGMVEKTKY